MLEKPICAVTSGNDVHIMPGSERCLSALISLHIIETSPGGERFNLPRVNPTDDNDIRNKFAKLSKTCARCSVFTQAFPDVPKALGV